MPARHSFLSTIKDLFTVITALPTGQTFPASLATRLAKYSDSINLFGEMVARSPSSAGLLAEVRNHPDATQRMALLKIFRRCVSLSCDTEATKKIKTITTESLVANLGHTFKNILALKTEWLSMDCTRAAALAALMGENDDRGQLGYALTGAFFDWFVAAFPNLSIDGPRGAGKDVELSSVLSGFTDSCPCDFIISCKVSRDVLAIGFARYDSSRGGAQSDDRTGGNANKVDKLRKYALKNGKFVKIIFLADGPGLAHKDTWEEACKLDDDWENRVRVATLKLAGTRITEAWIRS